jgi:hypothetical protein
MANEGRSDGVNYLERGMKALFSGHADVHALMIGSTHDDKSCVFNISSNSIRRQFTESRQMLIAFRL